MTKETTCFFTGHRSYPREQYESIRSATESIIRTLYDEGYRNFICGGALGYDQLAAETVMRLRNNEYADMKLHLYIPCEGQAANFAPGDKFAYDYVRERADSEKVLYPRYVRGCMHARNRAMADDSSICIAYLKKPTGGTAYTVDYAQKKGIKIIYID